MAEGAVADGPERPFNPWLAMWVRPRRTIRRILDTDSGRGVGLLAALMGVSNALGNASNRSLGDDVPLLAILVMACLLGPIGGYITLYVWGWLIGFTGRWLKGRAKNFEVRSAFAWSNVPNALGLALFIPALALFREELFTTATPRIEASLSLSLWLLAFVASQFVLAIWSFVTLVRAVAEVHGFGAWKGLLNVLSATAIVGLVVLAIALPFVLLRGGPA